MAENEDAFAIEAQNQAAFSGSQVQLVDTQNGRPPTYRSAAGLNAADEEESPLLPRKSPVKKAVGRDTSPSRTDAITKPWSSFEGLPWNKRPSVSDINRLRLDRC